MLQEQITKSMAIVSEMQAAIARGNRLINRAMLKYELNTLVWLVQSQRARRI